MNRLSAIIAALFVMAGCASHRLEEDGILYMAIGASDAVGVGARPLSNGYVFRIEDALEDRDKNVHLLNVGVPGANLDTLADAVQVALRVGAEPDLVTIWVGANDIIDGVDPEKFEDELDNLLDRLDQTDAFIAIADIPDLTELPRFREDPVATVTHRRIDAFNNAIEGQAEEHEAALVQLSEEEVEERFVSDVDGFHPNDRGHRRIAELFLEVIEPEVAEGGHSQLLAGLLISGGKPALP
jgi:lysophospholipase L1-like esterase